MYPMLFQHFLGRDHQIIHLPMYSPMITVGSTNGGEEEEKQEKGEGKKNNHNGQPMVYCVLIKYHT